MPARDVIPKPVVKLKAHVGWPMALKRDRVGLAFIALAMKGHVNVPAEKLPDLLVSLGFPQIGFAVREQIDHGRVHSLGNVDLNDELAVRMFVKNVIKTQETQNGK